MRPPDSELVKSAERLRELNASATRDPEAVRRFLEKHLDDPAERESIAAKVERAELERAALADRVPSGWRALTVEDVARDLSPEYTAHIKHAERLRTCHAKATRAVEHRDAFVMREEAQKMDRWGDIGLARRLFHLSGLYRDPTIDSAEVNAHKGCRGLERWQLRRAAIVGQLNVSERRAAMALEVIRSAAERELAERQRVRKRPATSWLLSAMPSVSGFAKRWR